MSEVVLKKLLLCNKTVYISSILICSGQCRKEWVENTMFVFGAKRWDEGGGGGGSKKIVLTLHTLSFRDIKVAESGV